MFKVSPAPIAAVCSLACAAVVAAQPPAPPVLPMSVSPVVITGLLDPGEQQVCGYVEPPAHVNEIPVTVTEMDGTVVEQDWTDKFGRHGEFCVRLTHALQPATRVRADGVDRNRQSIMASSRQVSGGPGGLFPAPTVSVPIQPGLAKLPGQVDSAGIGTIAAVSATVTSPATGGTTTTSAAVGADGAFALTLPALAAEDVLEVVGTNSGGKAVTESVTGTVGSKPAPLAAPPAPARSAVVINEPLNEGGRVVKGYVPADAFTGCSKNKSGAAPGPGPAAAPTPTGPCATKVVVLVYGHATTKPSASPDSHANNPDADHQQLVERQISSTLSSNDDFSIAVTNPLITGETVHVVATDDSLNAVSDVATASVGSPTDWGRVRAYLSGGGVLATNDNFSSVSPMARFLVDVNWWQYDDMVASDHSHDSRFAGDPPAVDGHSHKHLRFWHVRQVNSFFEARLTEIGTTACAQPSGATTNSNCGTASNTAATTSSGTSPGGQATGVQFSQFVTSQKAALIQTGFYIPFYGDGQTWVFNGERNAVFWAPIVRAGIITAQLSSSTPAAGRATSGGGSTTTTTTTASEVFEFWSAGLMFGHQKLPDTRDRAPEVISYLHMSVGKWSNYQEPIPQTGTEATAFRTPWRVAMEGRFKIPASVFEIGFDANFSPTKAPIDNDLRFVFGARIEIGDIVGKLSSLGLQ